MLMLSSVIIICISLLLQPKSSGGRAHCLLACQQKKAMRDKDKAARDAMLLQVDDAELRE